MRYCQSCRPSDCYWCLGKPCGADLLLTFGTAKGREGKGGEMYRGKKEGR
jgi:hypothetical protein